MPKFTKWIALVSLIAAHLALSVPAVPPGVDNSAVPDGQPHSFSFGGPKHSGFHLDGKLIGHLDRRVKPNKHLRLPARIACVKLEILVEGFGHINYTTHKNSDIGMEFDRKGLFGSVKLADQPLTGWSIHDLALKPADIVAAKLVNTPSTRRGSHFRATFTVNGEPQDTFFDLSKYTKGVVWVNGHNLGRYWEIGPQFRLYCPASWLKAGKNVIDVLDLEMTAARPIRACVERNFAIVNQETRACDDRW